MKITTVFYSLQGEGPAVGRPAIFVRLAGCNKNCLDCDEKKKYGNKFEEVESSSIVSRVQNYLKTHPNSRIIFTGGEPLLQPTAISEIMNGLPGQLFDIETNGTINNQEELFKRFNIMVISPKKDCFTSSKDRNEFITNWLKISDSGRKNIYFKFVVGNLPWAFLEAEIKDMFENTSLNPARTWLMPAGDNNQKLSISGKNTWKVACRLGTNFSDRLHIRNSGK
jgi:organic radical activating enzyme